MINQGIELKKRKKSNPLPKCPESEITHYRNVTRQNEWLRANIFDSVGNYLYCFTCIISSLGISKDRLTHQRNLKRHECQHPIVQSVKSEVEVQRLGQYVLMPADIESLFKIGGDP